MATKTCDLCHRKIRSNNYRRHRNACGRGASTAKVPINEEWRQEDGSYACPYCSKTFSKFGVSTHIWRKHGDGKDHNPNRGYRDGSRVAWNAGLSEDVNPFVRKNSDGIRKYFAKNPAPSLGRKLSVEARRKISRRLTLNNRGGRCKWYRVFGQKVQGSWERDVACVLEAFEIPWIKVSSHEHTFTYDLDGKEKRYTPDFYLPDEDLYLEIKGYWWGDDRRKMDAVYEQYPETRIVLIEKDEYYKILQGELVWSQRQFKLPETRGDPRA